MSARNNVGDETEVFGGALGGAPLLLSVPWLDDVTRQKGLCTCRWGDRARGKLLVVGRARGSHEPSEQSIWRGGVAGGFDGVWTLERDSVCAREGGPERGTAKSPPEAENEALWTATREPGASAPDAKGWRQPTPWMDREEPRVPLGASGQSPGWPTRHAGPGRPETGEPAEPAWTLERGKRGAMICVSPGARCGFAGSSGRSDRHAPWALAVPGAVC